MKRAREPNTRDVYVFVEYDCEGFEFDEWKGIPICNKYINLATLKVARENQGKKIRTAKTSVMFKEHFDTEHFGKHLHEFDLDQTIVITEKLHGTSGRIGHVLVERDLNWKDRIAKFFGVKIQEEKSTSSQRDQTAHTHSRCEKVLAPLAYFQPLF